MTIQKEMRELGRYLATNWKVIGNLEKRATKRALEWRLLSGGLDSKKRKAVKEVLSMLRGI